MELLQKIIDLGYQVVFGISWDRKGYIITIRGLVGFQTKCLGKDFPKCEDLETGLKIVYDFVKE